MACSPSPETAVEYASELDEEVIPMSPHRQVIAEIEPFVLDSTQISEADSDLRCKITQAPGLCVSNFSDTFAEVHRKNTPDRRLLVAGILNIS